MVQMFQGFEDPRLASAGVVGEKLGESISDILQHHFINKTIDKITTDPKNKDLPYSERMGKLQSALRLHGPAGRQVFEDRLKLEQSQEVEKAFNKLKNLKGNDFIEAFTEIAPSLIASGNQYALGEMLPILQTQMRNKAMRQALDQNIPTGTEQPRPSTISEKPTAKPFAFPGTERGAYQAPEKAPEPPTGSIFPQKTIASQVQPEMTSQDIQSYARNLMQLDPTMEYGQALNNAISQANLIREQNASIEAQRTKQEKAQEKLTANIVSRAKQAGLLRPDDPESRTIAEKLALQYRNEPSETDTWEKVRTGMRDYDNARAAIMRSSTLPGPFQTIGRKLTGTYKDSETILKDLQPDIEKLKKHGLYDEARDLLVNHVGAGPDQAERAIFPLSKKAEADLKRFPPNPSFKQKPIIEKGTLGGLAKRQFENKFPSEESQLSGKEYFKFLNELDSYLTFNPDVNLIALRSDLNQNKKYAWQDISKALQEIIDKKNLQPTPQQEHEMRVIREAPLPGLSQIFNFLYTGAK